MQAAFVDIGLEKAAFLYAGDYVENIEGLDDDENGGGRGRRRRNRFVPNIESLLSGGQEIVGEIAKEPIGSKGARITSHVSIAGRHLVLTPWAQRVGVSRKIDSDRERRRLRDIVNRVKPVDLGFIIRTAGEGTREADLEADVKYLTTVWDDIQIKKDRVRAPAVLYEEPARPMRVIRDFANSETRRIVVDSPEAYAEMKSFVDQFVADPKPRLEHYEGAVPLFDQFGLEAQIDANLGRKVWLRSGGYLIIDQSEALTAIDVNTGRYVGKRDLEETVLKTNLEAVQEVVHQLRFRNLGGLIIIDLIDMESAENRDKVYRALQEALRGDKARTNILKISELGLVEMTRKRTRENLVQQLCEPCSFCEGRGYVLSAETVAYKLLREIRKDLPRFGGRQIAVSVSPRVGEMLQGPARRALAALSEKLGREIEVRTRPGLHQEQFEVEALDQGPAVPIPVPWFETREERAAAEAARRVAAEEARAAAARARAAEEEARRAAGTASAEHDGERAGAEVAAAEPDPGEIAAESTPEPTPVERDLADPAESPAAADFAVADAPSAPVDGGGEDSILRRLQNSEDA